MFEVLNAPCCHRMELRGGGESSSKIVHASWSCTVLCKFDKTARAYYLPSILQLCLREGMKKKVPQEEKHSRPSWGAAAQNRWSSARVWPIFAANLASNPVDWVHTLAKTMAIKILTTTRRRGILDFIPSQNSI